MTPDPYMASGGPADPQSWNRYAYAQNDPINRFDPTGLNAPMVDDLEGRGGLGPWYCPAEYSWGECYGAPMGAFGGWGGWGGQGGGYSLISETARRENQRLQRVAATLAAIVAAAKIAESEPDVHYPSYLYVSEDCYGKDSITGTQERRRTYELRDERGEQMAALIQEDNFVIFGEFSSGALFSSTKGLAKEFKDVYSAQNGGAKRELQTFRATPLPGHGVAGFLDLPLGIYDPRLGTWAAALTITITDSYVDINGDKGGDLKPCK